MESRDTCQTLALDGNPDHVEAIGIDAGGTLIKMACMHSGSMTLRMFPAPRLQEIAAWANGFRNAGICITGGKASALLGFMDREAEACVEFEATCRGARYFLGKNGLTEPSFILTNVGTGTSIHYVDGGKQIRVGGTGIGGGTIMGLSQLLCGLSDYETIAAMAAEGSRDGIDLKVRHIYEGAEPPIPGELTASNFGRILPGTPADRYAQADLAAAVIGLVGETAATASVLAAGQFGVSAVMFIGSSFIRNRLLADVAGRYTKLRGARPIFVQDGEYCGAVGALQQLQS